MAIKQGVGTWRKKPNKKHPKVHAKKRSALNKNSKTYLKRYRGQG